METNSIISILLFDQKSVSQIITNKRKEIKSASPRFFYIVNPWVLTLQPLSIDSIPVHYQVISETNPLENILIILTSSFSLYKI